jgi:hypothetical protein
MHRLCRRCGIPHLPFVEECPTCGEFIQTTDEAEQRKAEWQRIPEAERRKEEAEVHEQAMEMGLLRQRLHLQAKWLGIVGGILLLGVTLSANVITPSMVYRFIVGTIGAGCGCAAGWFLHRTQGGWVLGALLFGGGYALLLAITSYLGLVLFPSNDSIMATMNFVLFVSGGMVSGGGGIFLGAYIDNTFNKTLVRW